MGCKGGPDRLVAFMGSASAWAGDVSAECFGFDRWPSFRAAARSADTIVIGHVVDGYDEDSTSRFYTFAVEVDDVLRGRAKTRLEFREVVRSGLPETVCPGESILRVRIGERLAMAFGARYEGVANPVTAIAFVNWPPDPFLLPGVERLTSPTKITAKMVAASEMPRSRRDIEHLLVV